MNKSFSTHLMFQGDADSALGLYSKVFPEAEIQVEQRFGEDDPDKSGRVELARMNLGDQTFIVFDSPPVHNFTFTPAMSIFVTVHDAGEFESIFQQLSEGGEIAMPPDNYGFSDRFAWFQDKFQVSWQISLELK